MSQRYELKGKIGEGGIGTVHRAFDTQLKRDVAIKRLIPVDGGTTEAAAENLIKEATTLSALQHPNIVTVYDVGSDDQGGFVVMELLKGETFDETINRGALTYDDFHNVVTQTLEALIAAHHTGLIHRDLKPSNLMVNWMPSGKFQIKILDFGLAKFSKQPSVQTIDQGDAILGSIYFMAPEQFERIPLDARTDLYSMGCMYYQSLTGKYPFDGDTAPMVMASHLQNRVQPLANLRPDLPLWLCDWVMWLISRKMDDRPESAKFAYERFQAEKASPAGEAAAEAAAAAAEASQRAAVANFQAPVPAHPPAGYGTTQPIGAGRPPLSMAPKPGFPKWAMVTIPLLLALAIGIAVSKFGGRSERKNREDLMVKLHEMVEREETPPGNRATVDVVVDYMLDHSDNMNTTNSAIRILGALEGDGVDAAIADNLEKVESSRQLQGMLLTIGQRGYQAGTPALMAYASHKNADVQRAALAALTQLDGRQQLPKLVDLAVESIESGNGNPYSDYIVQIASGIPNPDLRTEAIRKAAAPLDGKTLGEILKMLGYLGGEAALGTIKDTLAGDDKDAKIGALLGLARWPDSSPNKILFEAATDPSDSHLQLVGVAAYVQNVARPSSLSAKKKLDQLEKVYSEIERSKDKKSLFHGLGSIIDPAAKELAESLAESDPAIARFANAAAARIEAGLQNLVTVTNDATLSAEYALLDAFTAKYDGSPDMLAITEWNHPQDRIYWPLRFEQPGTYSVEITQACKEDDQDEYEVTVADSKLEAKVRATGGDTTFKTFDIGEIEIVEPGGYTLGVAPKQIRGKLLMNLRKIKIEKN